MSPNQKNTCGKERKEVLAETQRAIKKKSGQWGKSKAKRPHRGLGRCFHWGSKNPASSRPLKNPAALKEKTVNGSHERVTSGEDW